MTVLTSKWAISLKHYRERLGYTQAALAAQLHVSVKTVSRWESGESEPDNAMKSRVRRTMLAHDMNVFRARIEHSPLYEIVRTIGGNDAVVIAVSRSYCQFHGLPDQSLIRDRRVDDMIAMSSNPEAFDDFRERLYDLRKALVKELIDEVAYVTGIHHVTRADGVLLLARWIAVPTMVSGTIIMHNTMTWEPCPDPMPDDEVRVTWLTDL